MSSAQTYHALINENPYFIDEINTSQLKENQLLIAMPFAKNNVLNPQQKKQLKNRVVVKLELVYTKYRKATSFNQKELNKNRLKELNRLVPRLFENRFWDFKLISQSNGNSPEACNNMFHGFIVTFRPNSTKNTLDLEANYLEKLFTFMVKKDSLDNDSTERERKISRLTTRFDKKWGYIHDTVWYADTAVPPSIPDFFYNQTLYNDSTVLNAFDRNKNWKNFIVVTDVTGSMSPYIAQVIVWLKKQEENKAAKYFVFFNDGDETPSNKKKPLETKGIYVTKNKGLGQVIKTVTKCMRNGSGGGEYLENDVEAIINGIKLYTDADEIILIADNLESMRDYDYINKIKKPVRVILCGAENRINVQYLDLARQTNGSIHTVKSDVSGLEKIKENEHFFIDGNEYMYKNKRFHSVYKCIWRHTVKNSKSY
ncbi:MAG: hypothetical protein COA97_03485 [Flavobacteriales bacterium]|nr:MAG: hypothetical protein COA97_03485 [Flavobacteriales bacterium]